MSSTPEPSPEASAGSEPAADAASNAPSGPRVLWQAKPLSREVAEANWNLEISTTSTAGGIGLALLGVAGFTPPTWFMGGLVLSVLQVRIAYLVALRQLRAHTRRHVSELALTEENGMQVLTLKCDGGVTRKLTLTEGPPTGGKAPLADVFRLGETFICLDPSRGSSDAPGELEELRSSDRGVASEEISVDPYPGESEEEVQKMLQPLSMLTTQHLKGLEGRPIAKPLDGIGFLARGSVISAAVILTGGFMINIFGRRVQVVPTVAA